MNVVESANFVLSTDMVASFVQLCYRVLLVARVLRRQIHRARLFKRTPVELMTLYSSRVIVRIRSHSAIIF